LHPTDPSPVMMERGIEIVQAVYANLTEYAQFLKDWEDRIEFESVWGRAVGVHSAYRGSDMFAYHHGFVLRVQTDPTKPYGDFRGPVKSNVDLTRVYQRLIRQEPDRWYLHQTKRLLVSNDDTTIGRKATGFNLQQLIDFVRK
jgi:hypothetical protein